MKKKLALILVLVFIAIMLGSCRNATLDSFHESNDPAINSTRFVRTASQQFASATIEVYLDTASSREYMVVQGRNGITIELMPEYKTIETHGAEVLYGTDWQ